MNNMRKVLHDGAPTWANSCKEKRGVNGTVYEYRCTVCGETGHPVVKEGANDRR